MAYALVGYYLEKEMLRPAEFTTVLLVYMCCFIIHFNMQPRTLAAVERLNYLFLHSERFENIEIPAIVCLMQFLSEIYVELANYITTYYTYDIVYIVTNYVALMVISYIDQQYYDS